jgi:hypothetical protein
MTEFIPFPKIQRYETAELTITEKIDGTNGCLVFTEDGNGWVQSRNRIITPGKTTDNAGFAGWVESCADELFDFFGPGRHYGEWWGQGIQRGYDMSSKVFSPFNTHRFPENCTDFPDGVQATPVLTTGSLSVIGEAVDEAMNFLATEGSVSAPGFRSPEGVMVYSQAFGYLKVPFEKAHKWELKGEKK